MFYYEERFQQIKRGKEAGLIYQGWDDEEEEPIFLGTEKQFRVYYGLSDCCGAEVIVRNNDCNKCANCHEDCL
jgi:hypothetical protein